MYFGGRGRDWEIGKQNVALWGLTDGGKSNTVVNCLTMVVSVLPGLCEQQEKKVSVDLTSYYQGCCPRKRGLASSPREYVRKSPGSRIACQPLYTDRR